MSETSTCRERLSKFCIGKNGLDIGAGGDPIVPWAISIDRDENSPERSHVGNAPTNLVGEASDLYWFKDGVLDFVYSSHVLEDAVDTCAWLKEWMRVIKPGGHLVLFLPDELTYVNFCKKNGQLPNQAHKHKDFSMRYVKDCLEKIGYGQEDIVREADVIQYGNPYSFDLVVKKKS